MRTGKLKKTGKAVNVYAAGKNQYIIENPKTGDTYTTYDLSEINMEGLEHRIETLQQDAYAKGDILESVTITQKEYDDFVKGMKFTTKSVKGKVKFTKIQTQYGIVDIIIGIDKHISFKKKTQHGKKRD